MHFDLISAQSRIRQHDVLDLPLPIPPVSGVGLLGSLAWPAHWRFTVDFHRYSDQYCEDGVSEHGHVKQNHCFGKHAFTSFAFSVTKHNRIEKDWAKYGNCTLVTYEHPHCEGREIAHLSHVRTPLECIVLMMLLTFIP